MNIASQSQGPPKRKEIYKYEAPWCVYSMNWSVRPDKRFRLALGSFMEEYNNKVLNVILFNKVPYKLVFSKIIIFKDIHMFEKMYFCVFTAQKLQQLFCCP